jgi:hypothetical protein
MPDRSMMSRADFEIFEPVAWPTRNENREIAVRRP